MADTTFVTGTTILADWLNDVNAATYHSTYGPAAGSSSIVTTGTVTAGTWSSALASETYSLSATVTAGTNAQAQGALTTDINLVTTTAASPSGLTLPTATAGRKIIIINKGTNSINVYPASGGTIDALSANAAIAIPVNGRMEFAASSTTQWYSSVNTSFGAGLISLAGNFTTSGAFGLTLTTTAATNATFPAGTNNIGYLEIPQNSKSAAYTTVLADSGKHLYHPGADTTARTWTIDSNANVAYPIGTALTFINDTSAGTLTIAITSDTLVLAGAGTTGNRTLAPNGIATAVKMTATRWIISGTGLT